jgi:hypothetical protein
VAGYVQNEQPQFSDSLQLRGVDGNMYDTRRRFYAVFCRIMCFPRSSEIANSSVKISTDFMTNSA